MTNWEQLSMPFWTRLQKTLLQAFCGLMMILLVTFLVLSCVDMVRNRYAGNKKEESEEKQETVTVEPKEEEPDTEDIQPVLLQKEDISLTDTDIYSFLQGPAAWENRTDWGGSWCNMILADQYFGAFGCGLCDLANIYSTLTPYECSPIDMYYYAQEASGYTPVSGLGAIDWPELQDTLQSVGINCELRTKDDNYEDFQNNYRLLRNLIDTCAAHGIKLVGVLTPLNPRYKETGAFGYRGLRRSDATQIIHELDSLSGVYPNFILMDENKMGNHDYTDEMAMDNSHLSPRGAEQLTHRIDSLIKTLNIDFEN